MKEPLVYIVLLVWNGYEDTIECIESLKKISYKNYKIVIVDNASTNDSVTILKRKYPGYEFVKNSTNLGYSGGCNVGIKLALKNAAEYVLLLNNDTIVDPSFLTELIVVGESVQNIGILSPYIYYKDNTDVIWSSGINMDIRKPWPFIDINMLRTINKEILNPRQVDLVSGCAMLIKKSVFKSIGFLREEYFLYFEDMDFSLRAHKKHKLIFAVPKATVWHKIGSSSSKLGKIKVKVYFSRNLILFYKLNHLSTFPIRWHIHELALALRRGQLGMILGILKGIYLGFRGKKGVIQ